LRSDAADKRYSLGLSMPSQTVSPSTRCPDCGNAILISAASIIAHLYAVPTPCQSCGKQHDWWQITVRSIDENFMGNEALSFVGAKTTVFSMTLYPGKRATYRFSENGIPLGAKILYVNYTPNGGKNGLFPLEWHGNVPTRRFPADEVILQPTPILPDEPGEETKLAIMVTWVSHSFADDAWQSIYDAFEAFIANRYPSVIVPANVAVESSLLLLLTRCLDPIVGKKKTEDFLTSAATYSHQLNVIMPLLTKPRSLPQLPTHIVGELNRLRSLRNKLAHSGATDKPLERKETAQLLAAALFGFHYIDHLRTHLLPPGIEA
jgi:hypothetical protein